MIAKDLVDLAVSVDQLALLPGNPRRGDVEAIARSLARFGQRKPVVAKRDGTVVAGNHTLQAAKQLGWDELAVVWVDDDEATAQAFALADNRTAELGGYDEAALLELIEQVRGVDPDLLEVAGWLPEAVAALEASLAESGDVEDERRRAAASLAERFVVPPFSVLDARQGYWQDRKRAWLGLGIESELGRDARAFNKGGGSDPVSERIRSLTAGDGTSIFDPVICELACRWFCPPHGSVLDPFAGGSVRGIVAAWLGHPYVGIDLGGEQVRANREQAERILQDGQRWPDWREGDSQAVLPDLADESVDLLFTCPPYYDLEVYSGDPRDLSRAGDYGAFLDSYAKILHDAARCLRPNRFAVLVVGEVRDKAGYCHGLIPDTIRAMEAAGCHYYNEAVLVTPAGTLPARTGRVFQAGRKLGKAHQNVLVFYKGDPKAIRAEFGEVDPAWPIAEEAEHAEPTEAGRA